MDIVPPKRGSGLRRNDLTPSLRPSKPDPKNTGVSQVYTEKSRVDPKAPASTQKGQPKKRSDSSVFSRAFAWLRQVAFSPMGLAVWTLLVVLVVVGVANFSRRAIVTQDAVMEDGAVALSYVAEASTSLSEKDFEGASYKFNAAAERFIAAEQAVSDLSSGADNLLAILPVKTSVTSQSQLLEAGGNLAIAGKYLSRALEPFDSAPDVLDPLKSGMETSHDEGIPFTESVAIAAQNLKFAELKLTEAEANLERVDIGDLPEDIQPQAQVLKDTLPPAVALVRTLVDQTDVLLVFLGHDQRRTYLVLFQNDHELRPTGGFIGTIGLLSLDQGAIEEITVEGPYHLDGQMQEKYDAPEPIRLIQGRAYMRDMNFFLDFPTSAERISWYLDKSPAQSVDGVLALNASIMEDLLEVTGPVEMPSYDATVNSETFYEATQYEVEIDYDKERNYPKEFVSDMIPMVLRQAFESEDSDYGALASLISSSLQEKDVMLWFEDEDLQQAVEDLGYSGEIPDTDLDYLAVVGTNVGGGKTDAVINQEVLHDVEIQADGSVVDEVTITREHTGDPEDMWEGLKNVSYMRVYVPLGSELLDAEGFDTDLWHSLLPVETESEPDPVIGPMEENMRIHEPTKTRVMTETGRTVFGNWVGLEAGDSSTITLRYQLPFKVSPGVGGPTATYGAFFQKQPGSRNVTLKSSVRYPTRMSAMWQYSSDDNLVGLGHSRSFESEWNRDKTYAVVFQ